MQRYIGVGVAVLLAVAVLTVLITPDQTDDGKALLHKCSLQVYLSPAVHLLVPNSNSTIVDAPGFSAFDYARDILNLTCVRLC